MGRNTTIYKIIVGLLIMVITAIASGQTRITKTPIVSDKAVGKIDSLRIVDKDEQQRIVNSQSERVQKLEDKIKDLEMRIRSLESQAGG